MWKNFFTLKTPMEEKRKKKEERRKKERRRWKKKKRREERRQSRTHHDFMVFFQSWLLPLNLKWSSRLGSFLQGQGPRCFPFPSSLLLLPFRGGEETASHRLFVRSMVCVCFNMKNVESRGRMWQTKWRHRGAFSRSPQCQEVPKVTSEKGQPAYPCGSGK